MPWKQGVEVVENGFDVVSLRYRPVEVLVIGPFRWPNGMVARHGKRIKGIAAAIEGREIRSHALAKGGEIPVEEHDEVRDVLARR